MDGSHVYLDVTDKFVESKIPIHICYNHGRNMFNDFVQSSF